MSFETFTIITFIITILIVPFYFWLMRISKKTWIKSSHDTQGGSMTITIEHKVTWMDPIIRGLGVASTK